MLIYLSSMERLYTFLLRLAINKYFISALIMLYYGLTSIQQFGMGIFFGILSMFAWVKKMTSKPKYLTDEQKAKKAA